MTVLELANRYRGRCIALAKELCVIPSPSGQEILKARFLKQKLEDVYGIASEIDEQDNVICEVKGKDSNRCMLFCAHTDTVFPIETKLFIQQEGNRMYCPSIKDDTINCAGLFCGIGVLVENKIIPECDLIFAFNSGEEGTGNLRGIRHLVKTYRDRLSLVMALDLGCEQVVTRAVGCKRYQVTVKNEGGHSWFASDKINSIAVLSKIINRIYKIPMGKRPKTTYNVGEIHGGRSINTVAPEASMLLDLRSEDIAALKLLETQVMKIIDKERAQVQSIEVSCIGDRPCGNGGVAPMVRKAIDCVNRKHKMEPVEIAASTDANIPFFYGIPAFSTGIVLGGGEHSEREYIELGSLEKGLAMFFSYLLHFAGDEVI